LFEIALAHLTTTLRDHFPRDGRLGSNHRLGRFQDYSGSWRLTLCPAQAEAVLDLLEDKIAILSTPTGSGMSRVAAVC
jgi:hypothetical protein